MTGRWLRSRLAGGILMGRWKGEQREEGREVLATVTHCCCNSDHKCSGKSSVFPTAGCWRVWSSEGVAEHSLGPMSCWPGPGFMDR